MAPKTINRTCVDHSLLGELDNRFSHYLTLQGLIDQHMSDSYIKTLYQSYVIDEVFNIIHSGLHLKSQMLAAFEVDRRS
jgi:hypothetical protein